MDNIEEWRKLPSNENYLVSNLGRVQVLPRISKNGRKLKGKILNPYLSYQSYLVVGISGKIRTVHQLVCEAFLFHKPCGYKLVVDHINNISTDNRLINLQLISQRKNSSKDRKGGSSEYVGVYWNKQNKKWMSRIKINGKAKYLGYFNCELLAHQAYQTKLNQIANG